MKTREEKRNLETIPVGSLGVISLAGCRNLGQNIHYYLVKWTTERDSDHKDSLALAS